MFIHVHKNVHACSNIAEVFNSIKLLNTLQQQQLSL